MKLFYNEAGGKTHIIEKARKGEIEIGRPFQGELHVMLTDQIHDIFEQMIVSSEDDNLTIWDYHQTVDTPSGAKEFATSPIQLNVHHSPLRFEFRIHGDDQEISKSLKMRKHFLIGQGVDPLRDEKKFFNRTGGEEDGGKYTIETAPIITGKRYKFTIQACYHKTDGWFDVWMNGARIINQRNLVFGMPSATKIGTASRWDYFGLYHRNSQVDAHILLHQPYPSFYLDEVQATEGLRRITTQNLFS